ncbi:MAG TPA: hypothetical protein VMB84_06200 [Stellaceae bacterium]|nr:hypothetical protein [Stellaceae bacterium]
MRQLLTAALSALLLVPAVARADDDAASQDKGCGLVSGALISQGQGQVMINCVGVSEEFGGQLAGILTYVLQNRLDPEIVIAKLNEIEGVPEGDGPRSLTADQGQAIVQSLLGSKPAVIAMVANPGGSDSGDYALAIATRLGMAGWQIEGSQIRRLVPPGLDSINGLVLVVRNEKAPPEKALALKKAMAAAKIYVPIVADPQMPDGGTMLWVGKRPSFNPAAAATTQ